MKRTFDVIASGVGLLVLALPLAVIALAIRLDSAGPVFYRQVRVGRGGTDFRIFKFRTMRTRSTGPSITVGDDPRVTRVGRFLRAYKLDELPQLINVFVGEMSLVGPRPEVPEYAHVYPEQERVWQVRPGITDPVSIRFRNESELLAQAADPEAYYRDVLLKEKTAAYLEYIERASLRYDVAVIFETLKRIVSRPEGTK